MTESLDTSKKLSLASGPNPERETTKQHKRMFKVSDTPLDPPRSVKYAGGVIAWEPPQTMWNVTHFRIYRNTEYNLVREIPAGQRELSDNFSADRLFISSYNANTKQESRKIPLLEPIYNGQEIRIVFGIPGAVTVEDDTCPHVEITVGSGFVVRCKRAYVNAKTVPTSDLLIDCQYSKDKYDTALADRTWNNVFATSTGDLVLATDLMQRQYPLSTFASDPLYLPDRSLVRCNVKGGNGSDVIIQIVCEIHPATDVTGGAYSVAIANSNIDSTGIKIVGHVRSGR